MWKTNTEASIALIYISSKMTIEQCETSFSLLVHDNQEKKHQEFPSYLLFEKQLK
jgi:hypothetical protein